MSCHVVLRCRVLPCLVLSCPVLSCLVLSCAVLSLVFVFVLLLSFSGHDTRTHYPPTSNAIPFLLSMRQQCIVVWWLLAIVGRSFSIPSFLHSSTTNPTRKKCHGIFAACFLIRCLFTTLFPFVLICFLTIRSVRSLGAPCSFLMLKKVVSRPTARWMSSAEGVGGVSQQMGREEWVVGTIPHFLVPSASFVF